MPQEHQQQSHVHHHSSSREKRRKAQKRKRRLWIALAVVSVLGIGAFAAYQLTVGQLFDNSVPIVDRPDEVASKSEDEYEDVPIYRQVDIDENVINVLLVGTDSRDPDQDRGRSDTMMLASYNRSKGTATLTSLLRDNLVPIEGYGQSRLNHSFAWGGVGLTINTINDVFDLDIQRYIVINFENLEQIVDKIGGVTVKLTAEESNYYNQKFGYNLKEGENRLNGPQALNHARNRTLDSDFGRTRRQRDLLYGMYVQEMQNGSISNLTSLISFCLTQAVTNIPPNELYTLALEIIQLDELELQEMVIPADGTWSYATYQGMSVIQMDVEENKRLLHQYVY